MGDEPVNDRVDILIVEDSPTQTEQLRYLLEENGYRVTAAANGREALALARELRPTLVISDIVMPEMDGYGLSRAIKADERLKETPVILLTSLSEPGNIIRSLEAGADNFIRKPYEDKYLLSRVSNILTSIELREAGSLRMGVEVFLGGHRHFITSERQQILDFLISTYEEIAAYNDELEAQQRELEEREAELAGVNATLEARQAELERALEQLRAEKERVEALHSFSALLASETDPEALAQAVLAELCDPAEADVGLVYALQADGGERPHLLAAQGVDAARLPALLEAGTGLASDALASGRTISASSGPASATFVDGIAVGSELHVPLVQGERALGVLTLARRAGGEFSRTEIEAIEHLANQAAVALANVLSLGSATRTATITRAVLEAADAISMFDLEGRLVLRNAAAERLLGELELGKPGHLADAADALAGRTADPAACRRFFASAAGDPAQPALHEFELPDSRRVFQQSIAPVSTPDGRLIGQLLTTREVTAEREVDRLKSELVATVSHELRTPLTAILGFVELLATREVDETTRASYLELVYGEARRLHALIDDFLDLQRIEAGAFEIAREPVDLAAVVTGQVDLFRRQSTVHSLRLALPDRPAVVRGDAARIAQLVANLLSNAIKYSPAGGPVDVAVEPGEESVRVSVRDYGLGIAASQQSQLFRKFFRVDSSPARAIGGTGLGLALSREIVEGHGGRIWVESAEGEGSTFAFELPVD